MTTPFVHLHLHTEYSMVDGTVRINSLVERAKELGMPAIAVTDQHNLFALVKFYRAAEAAGIKPIIGSDVLIRSPDDPEIVESYRKSEWNFVILVVEAWREGVLLGRHSIGGVVHGIFPVGTPEFTDELEHPERWTDIADEAVAEAELKLQALCATLKLQATNERTA